MYEIEPVRKFLFLVTDEVGEEAYTTIGDFLVKNVSSDSNAWPKKADYYMVVGQEEYRLTCNSIIAKYGVIMQLPIMRLESNIGFLYMERLDIELVIITNDMDNELISGYMTHAKYNNLKIHTYDLTTGSTSLQRQV